ncbi:glycoside hydrolase family 26 protein [Streptomyces sp. NPDC004111]|uniref:glycoside hydrolase family 26 protein n=1 Tax=Streptomyces sp. NPDC004111 TaxID=3364690 RepID=UPI0036B7C946
MLPSRSRQVRTPSGQARTPLRTARGPFRRARGAAVVCAALVLAAGGCTTFSSAGRDHYRSLDTGPPTTAAATQEAREAPYDLTPLLRPAGGKKYLGVAAEGLPGSLEPLRTFAAQAGRQPNLVGYYAAWGDRFDEGAAAAVWHEGALPMISWEPHTTPLADIAAGRSDDYIRSYAEAVRELNLPVAISFAHEMNGDWYPWGTKKATPAEFTAAWKRTHDLFEKAGARSVIWVWTPNVVNPMPQVKLKPFWPGEKYVDWVGVIGYYAKHGPTTFETLFDPTLRQIRTFTRKPVVIPETASEGGERKPADIEDLFRGVEKRPDVLGFIWFDYDKEADWRISSGPLARRTFREQARGSAAFGFDPGKLR